MLVFHNLDNKTYSSQRENDVLKVVSQTIANNARLTTLNNPLVALRRGGKHLVQQAQNQVIKVIQYMSLDICKEPG
jgi:hypothetical protein